MQQIKIDFDNPGLPQHLEAMEGDAQSRFFQATLYRSGVAYTPPADAVYSIMYRGFGEQNQGWYDTIEDDTGKRDACVASGNVVTCEIDRHALIVPGHVSIVLCITNDRGYMLKSRPILTDARNDNYSDTVEVESYFRITGKTSAWWLQNKKDVQDLVDKATAEATKAENCADASANSAAASKKSADDSAASASASADSAAAAARSESASAGSATAAANSASAAEESKTAAATSESNAAKHEEAAKKAANEAGAKAGTDKTLTIENAPADAKATGDALTKKADKNVILDEDGNVIFYSKAAVDELLAGKLDLTGGTMTGSLILPSGHALGYTDNAGNRNAMPPRDRSLGSPTTEHFEMIGSDKYNELFLGDYWTVDGVDWVIGDFKFWYNTGDTACTKPHVVVFPRNSLYTFKFNPTGTTEGGYVGSDLYKNGLTQAKQMVAAAFGSAHILNHREYLVNAVTNGKPTGIDWYDSTVELMNENMVYGGRQFSPMPDGATEPWNTCYNYTIDKSQLSLFRYEPWMSFVRDQPCWLRDVVSATAFARVNSSGNTDCVGADYAFGVRPAVGICQQ